MNDIVKNLRDRAAFAHADLSVADEAADDLVKRPPGRSEARTADDLIRLLRGEECNDCVNNFCTCDVVERAADCIEAHAKRIEELEAALRSIARNTCCGTCQEAALVARAALGEKE